MNGWVDGWMNGRWKDKWEHRWMDGLKGWMGRWTDGEMSVLVTLPIVTECPDVAHSTR